MIPWPNLFLEPPSVLVSSRGDMALGKWLLWILTFYPHSVLQDPNSILSHVGTPPPILSVRRSSSFPGHRLVKTVLCDNAPSVLNRKWGLHKEVERGDKPSGVNFNVSKVETNKTKQIQSKQPTQRFYRLNQMLLSFHSGRDQQINKTLQLPTQFHLD